MSSPVERTQSSCRDGSTPLHRLAHGGSRPESQRRHGACDGLCRARLTVAATGELSKTLRGAALRPGRGWTRSLSREPFSKSAVDLGTRKQIEMARLQHDGLALLGKRKSAIDIAVLPKGTANRDEAIAQQPCLEAFG